MGEGCLHTWVCVFVRVCPTTLQGAYTTCPREVPFSARAIKAPASVAFGIIQDETSALCY